MKKYLFPALIIAAFFGGSCSRDTGAPNIVLYIADDLSYNDLSLHGHPVVKTPNVDRLASEGMELTRMFTTTAMCAPSRSAMYTGLFPHRNGCHMNHGSVKDTIKSLPHYMEPLGYRVALANKTHIKPKENFPFEYLETEAVEEFIQSGGSSPFCLIYASNEPYAPHTEGRIRAEDVVVPPHWIDTPEARDLYARYLNGVEIMDREIGDLLDMLERNGKSANTVVILTSDHGFEYFARWTCYEAGLHVPFIIKWKRKIKAGSSNPALASLLDIFPTFIEMAGGEIPDNIDGISLMPVLSGKTDRHRSVIYGAHTNRGIISGKTYPIRSIRAENFKYIMNLCPDTLFQNITTHGYNFRAEDGHPEWKSWLRLAEEDPSVAERVYKYRKRPAVELYDLENDPYELNNLAEDGRFGMVLDGLRRELKSWMNEQGDEGLASEMEVPLRKPDK